MANLGLVFSSPQETCENEVDGVPKDPSFYGLLGLELCCHLQEGNVMLLITGELDVSKLHE